MPLLDKDACGFLKCEHAPSSDEDHEELAVVIKLQLLPEANGAAGPASY